MTKQEHIDYWVETAADDWQATQNISIPFGRTAVVFAYWTLEKLSKALWVQYHDAIPPATDTVATILADTPFILTPAQLLFTQHLEAAHDEVLEPDPEHPLQLQETFQELLQQATSLRQQLLEMLRKAGVISEREPAEPRPATVAAPVAGSSDSDTKRPKLLGASAALRLF